MGETDDIIINAIWAQIYKLNKEEQTNFDYCVKELEHFLQTYDMAAQLAIALVGARLAAYEE